MAEQQFAVGERVKLWVGLTLRGYPDQGTVRQFMPDYPTGPSYEVVFDWDSWPPYACLKPEWLFPLPQQETK